MNRRPMAAGVVAPLAASAWTHEHGAGASGPGYAMRVRHRARGDDG